MNHGCSACILPKEIAVLSRIQCSVLIEGLLNLGDDESTPDLAKSFA
jgi:hypothetical protein